MEKIKEEIEKLERAVLELRSEGAFDKVRPLKRKIARLKTQLNQNLKNTPSK